MADPISVNENYRSLKIQWKFKLTSLVNHCGYNSAWKQWRNRRGGGGGQGAEYPPEISDRQIFADVSRKKRQGKKGKGVKIEKKKRKIVKGKVGNWKSYKEKGDDLFFFFFFFFFFCFSVLKQTEIYFGSTKIGIFYREEAFHAGKKIRKNDFAPSEKYACYAPAWKLN